MKLDGPHRYPVRSLTHYTERVKACNVRKLSVYRVVMFNTIASPT